MEPGPDHPSSRAAPQGRLQSERVLRPRRGLQGQTTGRRPAPLLPLLAPQGLLGVPQALLWAGGCRRYCARGLRETGPCPLGCSLMRVQLSLQRSPEAQTSSRGLDFISLTCFSPVPGEGCMVWHLRNQPQDPRTFCTLVTARLPARVPSSPLPRGCLGPEAGRQSPQGRWAVLKALGWGQGVTPFQALGEGHPQGLGERGTRPRAESDSKDRGHPGRRDLPGPYLAAPLRLRHGGEGPWGKPGQESTVGVAQLRPSQPCSWR